MAQETVCCCCFPFAIVAASAAATGAAPSLQWQPPMQLLSTCAAMLRNLKLTPRSQ